VRSEPPIRSTFGFEPVAAAPVAAEFTAEPEVETASLWPEPVEPVEPVVVFAPEAELPALAARDAPEARPTIRIIDPLVEEDEGLYLEPESGQGAPVHPEERHEGKRGFFSLFGGGRHRYDAPAIPAVGAPNPPAMRSAPQRGGAQAALQAEPEALDATEDLDIPSFLRRLAN
jgi:cell division protein FtsZ